MFFAISSCSFQSLFTSLMLVIPSYMPSSVKRFTGLSLKDLWIFSILWFECFASHLFYLAFVTSFANSFLCIYCDKVLQLQLSFYFYTLMISLLLAMILPSSPIFFNSSICFLNSRTLVLFITSLDGTNSLYFFSVIF